MTVVTLPLLSRAISCCSPGRSSGLATSRLCLCCPDPALADTLAPDPLSLCDGHHTAAITVREVAPAVAPHPDVHLVEPAAVTPVPLQLFVSGLSVLLRRHRAD